MARIVHICPRYRPAHGGVELFFVKLSEELARRGHDVSVWTTDALTVQEFTIPSGRRLPAGPERMNDVEVRRFPVRYLPAQRYLRTAANWLPFGMRWKTNTLRWTPYVPSMTAAAESGGASLLTARGNGASGTQAAASDRGASSTYSDGVGPSPRWAANTEGPPALGRIDLVHAAGLPYSSLLYAGVRLAASASAPLIISPFTHVPPPGKQAALMTRAYLSPLNRTLLDRADRVFVQTEFERQTMIELGLRPSAQTVVGLGVDADECTGGERIRFREQHGLAAHDVVIGHLANKSWDKGTVDLLDAAETLWRRGVDFRLVLAGAEMPSFTERFRRVRQSGRIVNLGSLTDQERRDFYAAIDVFALPSYVESFGLSALEAALNHAAVVAYDHGGPGQIFTNATDGLLARVGDLRDLERCLEAVVTDRDRRTTLGKRGAQTARTFTWTRSLETALSAYDGLLTRR